jgi:branched-chain amino acid transport system substrate-binding protein
MVKAFQTSALAALFAAAAITGVRAADPIKIGVVTPLSGTYAGIGQQVRWGLDLAVKEVNAAGGIMGRPIELFAQDGVDLRHHHRRQPFARPDRALPA